MEGILNQPVNAAVLLAAVAVTIREVAWFVKTTRKNGPSAADRKLEKMMDALAEMNTNMRLLNEHAQREERETEKLHDDLREIARNLRT